MPALRCSCRANDGPPASVPKPEDATAGEAGGASDDKDAGPTGKLPGLDQIGSEETLHIEEQDVTVKMETVEASCEQLTGTTDFAPISGVIEGGGVDHRSELGCDDYVMETPLDPADPYFDSGGHQVEVGASACPNDFDEEMHPALCSPTGPRWEDPA